MTQAEFEKVMPEVQEKIFKAIHEVSTSMTLEELKQLDWYCSNADYYIALYNREAA